MALESVALFESLEARTRVSEVLWTAVAVHRQWCRSSSLAWSRSCACFNQAFDW